MFPAPSPNSQALFAQLASGGATPNTLDFHRTAMSAAAKREQQNAQQQSQQASQPQPNTSQPPEMTNGTVKVKTESKPASGPFDPHDNDAANGLFMLAQGRNGTQGASQFGGASGAPGHAHPAPAGAQNTNASPQISAQGASGESREHSQISDESEQARPNTRGKGRKNTGNGRRKAEDAPPKAPPAKKTKVNNEPPMNGDMGSMEPSDDEMNYKTEEGGVKVKMTDEEKRKNFLERNRYAPLPSFSPSSFGVTDES